MELEGLFLDPGDEATFEKISKTLFSPVSDGGRQAGRVCTLLIWRDFRNAQTLAPKPHSNVSDIPSSTAKWHRQEIVVNLFKQIHGWISAGQ